MTSKNLFFNLLKEDFKKRLWVFILASVVFFGTFGVVFTMALERWVDSYTAHSGFSPDSFSYGAQYDITEPLIETATLAEKVAGDVIEFIALNPWLIIVACVGAVICGMSGFSFLHSKKQVDFYHSLPVRRELLFAVRFTNGILFFVIPYVISLIYSFVLCGIFRALSWKIVQGGLVGLVIHLMGFTVVYLFTILAVLLTGKLLMSFLGFAVFCLYAPAMYLLIEALKDVFFITAYGGSMDFEEILFSMKYVSPVSYYCSLYYNVYNAETMKVFWAELGCFVLFAAVLAVVCLFLYRKRRSEASEASMSFAVSEPIVRILIAVPVGVLAGFMFFMIEQDYNGGKAALAWMIFGCILGVVLAHGFIESLFRGDIRKCLSHKWQLAASVAVAIVVPMFFYFDVFGFDAYLPKKAQVKEIAMYNNNLRFGGTYYNGDSLYVNAQDYALSVGVEDFDALYELAEILSEHAKLTRKNTFHIGRAVTYLYAPETEYGVYMSDFIIRYTLKSGKEVTRMYEYNYWAVLDLLEQIYNNEQFKESTSPIYAAEESGYRVQYVDCYSALTEDAYRIRVNGQELHRIYTEELRALTFDDLKETAGIGRLEFIYAGDWYSHSAILYPQMTRTIALLKESGYEFPKLTDMVDSIRGVNISYTADALKDAVIVKDEYGDSYSYIIVTEEMGYKSTVEYKPITIDKYGEYSIELTDPKEIKELLPHLIARSYSREFGPFPFVEENIQVSITFTYGEGEKYYEDMRWFYFPKGQIPEFLKEKMKANLHE